MSQVNRRLNSKRQCMSSWFFGAVPCRIAESALDRPEFDQIKLIKALKHVSCCRSHCYWLIDVHAKDILNISYTGNWNTIKLLLLAYTCMHNE